MNEPDRLTPRGGNSTAKDPDPIVTARDRFARSAACLWPTALITWGPGSAVPCHAHRCVQVIVALEGFVRVRQHSTALWHECRAAVIRSDADHEIDSSGSLVLMGFIASESSLGDALASRLRSNISIVSNAEAARWRRALGDVTALDAARVKRWITSTVVEANPARRMHPSVNRVMMSLEDHPLETAATSLAQLSAIAGLSASRFAHVFTHSIGMPLRPYLRWLRLQRAAVEIVRGHSATEAALAAGFSDVAHLTRTFRRTLGVTPRGLPSTSHGVASTR